MIYPMGVMISLAQKNKKKGKAASSHVQRTGIAESVISREFMALSPSELSELDAHIDKLIEASESELERAPILKNDHYMTDDVVERVGEDED